MNAPSADPQQQFQDAGQLPRRGFLKILASASAGVLAWRTAERTTVAQASSRVSSVLPAPPVLKRLPNAFREYPVPTYAPSGQELREIYVDRPDGFGLGSEELAFWYANPKHLLGFNSPTSVYIARRPQREVLSCAEGRAGIPVVLSMSSGETVQAVYHDGFWVLAPRGDGSLVWETRNVHSLLCHLRGFTIGVRGARLVGIDFDELTRIASSIA